MNKEGVYEITEIDYNVQSIGFSGELAADLLQEWLSNRGKEGWELCGIIQIIGPGQNDTGYHYYIFKRAGGIAR